jgi:hypothetical protein
MNYAVQWGDDALNGLGRAWIQAPDRQAVTRAQMAIDRLLGTDPLGHGTPVSEGLYKLVVPPLRVQFEVSEDERLVTVVFVRGIP